jgi:hypothetical protein
MRACGRSYCHRRATAADRLLASAAFADSGGMFGMSGMTDEEMQNMTQPARVGGMSRRAATLLQYLTLDAGIAAIVYASYRITTSTHGKSGWRAGVPAAADRTPRPDQRVHVLSADGAQSVAASPEARRRRGDGRCEPAGRRFLSRRRLSGM